MTTPTLESDIRKRVRKAARWARTLFVVERLVWSFAVCGTAVLLVGGLDWWLRGSQPWYRWTLTLLVGSVGFGVFVRWLVPAISWKLGELQTAWLIERSVPALRGQLAPTLSLITQGSGQQSARLARAAICETHQLLADLRPRRLVRWDRLRNGGIAAALVLVSFQALAWFAPVSSSIGMMRLSNPTNTYRWPTRFELSFAELPQVVPRNEPFTVVVEGRDGRLPRQVSLQVEPLDGAAPENYLSSVRGPAVEFRLPGSSGSLRIRAQGADGQTAWRTVGVADRPRLLSSEVTAEPPACLAASLIRSNGSLRAPLGSEVLWQGTSDQRLIAATLLVEQTNGKSEQLSLDISPDGRAFAARVSWTLDVEASYRVKITAETGLTTLTSAHDLQPQPNLAPQVEWRFHELLLNNEYYLVEGRSALIAATITDDFVWNELGLEVAPGAQTDEGEWDVAWREPSAVDSEASESDRLQPDEFDIQWTPPRGQAAEPSTRLYRGRIFAMDSCRLRGEGETLAFRVVSQDGYDQALAETWSLWLNQLKSIQRDFDRLYDESTTLRGPDGQAVAGQLVLLRQLATDMRRLDERLSTDDASLFHQLTELTQWSHRYQREQTTLGQVMTRMQTDWNQQLRPAVTATIELLERLRSPANDRLEVVPDPSEVTHQLKSITELLRSWLGAPDHLDLQQFWVRLKQIRNQQTTIRDQTLALQANQVAAPGTDDEQATTLSRQQTELANGLEGLQAQIQESHSAGELTGTGSVLNDLSQQLRQSAVSAWQRESSRLLQAGQLGSSLDAQNAAIAALDQLLQQETVTGEQGPSASAGALLNWLRELARRTDVASQELQMLQTQRASAAVAQRQQALLAELRRLNQQLSRWEKDWGEPGRWVREPVEGARQNIEAAEEELTGQQTEAAAESAAAAAEALRQGEAQLRERAADLLAGEQEFERQLLVKLIDWATRQAQLADNAEWVNQNSLGNEQRTARQLLATRQQELRGDIANQRSSWEAEIVPLLSWELADVVQEQDRVSEQLASEQPLVQSLERARRIARRLFNLARSQADAESSPSNAAENEATAEQAPPPVRPPAWQIQLAVIRARQQEILQRTQDLSEVDLSQGPNRAAVEALGARQRDLRERTAELARLAAQWESAAASTRGNTESTSPDLPGLPTSPNSSEPPGSLPGLPGIRPATPGDVPQSTTPTNTPATGGNGEEGEDIGEQRAPLASIETRMEIVLEYFAQFDCGQANQQVQQAILDELQQAAPSPDGDNPESQQGTTNSTQSGESAVGSAEVVDVGSLLPDALLERSGVWGHLPPQLQQRMRAVWVDQWIPGYEETSIEYFRQLGEAWEQERR